MTKQKCYIYIGIPCSGKSTEAEKQGLPVLSCDKLRKEISSERKVWEKFYQLVSQQTTSFIVDNTNVKAKYINEIRRHLKPEFDVEYVVFDIPLWKAHYRNIIRYISTGKWITLSSMNAMHDNFSRLDIEMVKRTIVVPTPIETIIEPVKYEENYGLPHCVIFDVDGTLAHKGDRSPYDWGKVWKDTVNDPVAYMLRMMRNDPDLKIFIFTGRDGVCEQDTRNWLGENDIHFDALFIRPAGNIEKDSIIKKRLFEEHIRGKYYCDFVVDDRQQVVDMWRKELGLTCFQVDYGNF